VIDEESSMPEPADNEAPNAEIAEVLQAMPDPDDADADVKWKALARAILPHWKAIAAGLASCSPTQRLVLKDIMDRGFGKAGEAKKSEPEKTGSLNVVILPALGSGAGTTLCPRCSGELT
jgi:hypothetical protein